MNDYEPGDRVKLKKAKSFDAGKVKLPAGSEGTVVKGARVITAVDFDDDTGNVNYRVVRSHEVSRA